MCVCVLYVCVYMCVIFKWRLVSHLLKQIANRLSHACSMHAHRSLRAGLTLMQGHLVLSHHLRVNLSLLLLKWHVVNLRLILGVLKGLHLTFPGRWSAWPHPATEAALIVPPVAIHAQRRALPLNPRLWWDPHACLTTVAVVAGDHAAINTRAPEVLRLTDSDHLKRCHDSAQSQGPQNKTQSLRASNAAGFVFLSVCMCVCVCLCVCVCVCVCLCVCVLSIIFMWFSIIFMWFSIILKWFSIIFIWFSIISMWFSI